MQTVHIQTQIKRFNHKKTCVTIYLSNKYQYRIIQNVGFTSQLKLWCYYIGYISLDEKLSDNEFNKYFYKGYKLF